MINIVESLTVLIQWYGIVSIHCTRYYDILIGQMALDMLIGKNIDNGVSCKHWLLRCCRSTLCLGVPSFFVVNIIWLQQMTGVPISTAAVIPFCMSQSNSALTLAFQWSGTGIRVWHAYDVASSLKSGSHLSKIAGFFT